MSKTITINVDDEHSPEQTLEEVLRLVRGGYTSGIDPTWDIVEDEDGD